MNEALIEIAKQVPLTAALIIAVRYLVKKLDAKEAEIKDLNMIIRQQQQDAIDAMSEQTKVNEKLIKYINGKD